MADYFLTEFPEAFFLECKMRMSDEDFEYWFEDEFSITVVGYARADLIWSPEERETNPHFFHFLYYNGNGYCMIARDVGDNTLSIHSDGLHTKIITDTDLELLKTGLSLV